MKIEVGQCYLTRCGTRADISGHTLCNRDWLWSLQGNWYDAATGRLVKYPNEEGKHYVSDTDHLLDIVKHVGPLD